MGYRASEPGNAQRFRQGDGRADAGLDPAHRPLDRHGRAVGAVLVAAGTTIGLHPQALALAVPSFTDALSMDYVLGNLLPDVSSSASVTAAASTQLTDDNSDLAVRGDIARSAFGVTGAGIKIGILSDSFNLKGGMAADIAGGNLPAGVQILTEGTTGHDEGRAMADLVHRIAPGAQIAFASATGSERASPPASRPSRRPAAT